MGGVNEQYDDIMDHEAAIPMIKESYGKAISKWQDKRDKYLKEKAIIDQYNKQQQQQYQKYDEKLHKYYQQQLQNLNNNYYNNYETNYNDDDDDDDDDYQRSPMATNTKQATSSTSPLTTTSTSTSKPKPKPQPKPIPSYAIQHKCPEYQYIPSKPKTRLSNSII